MSSQPEHLPPTPPSSANGLANGNGHAPSSVKGYIPLTSMPQVVVDQKDDFDLGHILQVLRRRTLTFVGVMALAAGGLTAWHFVRPTPPTIYQGSFDLLVEPVTSADSIDLNAFGERRSGNLDYDSQIRVLLSPGVLDPILANIQEQYPKLTYEALRNRLTIERAEDTKVLKIRYQGSDPETVQFVSDQLLQGFIDYSAQARQAGLLRGINFLDEQLDNKWQEVATIEEDLSDFQKQHNLVDVAATKASVTDRLNALLAKQENLAIELASLQELRTSLEDQVGFAPDIAVRVANLSASPQYQAVLDELRAIDREIAIESARFQTDTPMIQVLEDKQQQLLEVLNQESVRILGDAGLNLDSIGYQGDISQNLVQQLVDTANKIELLQIQNATISQVTEVLQDEIQYLADLSRASKQIERELTVAESSLNQMLTSRQDLRFQMAKEASPWELVDPMDVASLATGSSLARILLLNGLVSVLLGLGAALLQDKLDQVFHDAEDITAFTKLPNLALVPYARALEDRALLMNTALISSVDDLLQQKPMLVNADSPSAFLFAESFYSLHTNLRLLGSDSPMQAVTVTSSRPNEGKSTICAHLAIAATNIGQRVLLIDADMRKPSLHEIFGLVNSKGLSNIISDTAKVQDVIHTLSGNERLQIITAGSQPPAPGGLLSSRRMHQLVQGFRQDYDLIIIDTPPLIGITDAKLASTHTDGILLVTQIERTQRSEVQRVLSDLGNTMQAPLLGVAVNGVKAKGQKYGYHGSYYNHYYSYQQT
jgi:succinoglycan biosynthesis transport protein ExoP